MAPHIEYLLTNKCDLFSIGITMYYLYFGKYPYETWEQLLNKRPNMNFKIEEDEKLEDLIKQLVILNPNERISWDDYFNHPFFDQYEY